MVGHRRDRKGGEQPRRRPDHQAGRHDHPPHPRPPARRQWRGRQHHGLLRHRRWPLRRRRDIRPGRRAHAVHPLHLGRAQRRRRQRRREEESNNAFDAALATALYLCGTGANDLRDEGQARRAILRYNASGQYADDVLGHIRQYDQLAVTPLDREATAGGTAGKVIKLALAERGTKYVWGGGDIHGPTGGGFDCSGLLVYAYHQGAGITLPRTSQAMRSAGKAVGRADLRPGDLIVFNADGNWGHVGLYIGNGQMVHAPNPRTPGETASVTSGEWSRADWTIRRVL